MRVFTPVPRARRSNQQHQQSDGHDAAKPDFEQEIGVVDQIGRRGVDVDHRGGGG